ncbi:mucolipin-3 isoform X1 [Frankliniella occidentalis]|uniref:Mucolipin-3 isoform X1 n=1 Tax=Frankliniella occidentalis TaxID=133901 RepID=A0A6J1SHV7_FRAOC|nr:mucolipin-3 isoform X1 [Frankliniella occidentalis]
MSTSEEVLVNTLPSRDTWSGALDNEEEMEALVMNPEAQGAKASEMTPRYGTANSEVSDPGYGDAGYGTNQGASPSSSNPPCPEICTDQEVERMQRRLRFFFMNPIEKWHAKQRFPYKFLIQVIKIVLVTTQLCIFAHSRYKHVNYAWDNRVTFSHLFLRGWDTTREVNSYPPAVGPLALYVKEDFYHTLDYAVAGYRKLSDAIGPYSYDTDDNHIGSPLLSLYEYKEGVIYGFNESYQFNSEIDRHVINLTISSNASFSSKEYLISKNMVVNFSALVRASLEFSVKTVNFKAAGAITPPDCYRFDVKIDMDNGDQDGQMLLSLEAEPMRLVCQGDVEYITDNRLDYILGSILNCCVIIVCLLSLILCGRAIYRAQQLKNETIRFFKNVYGTVLSREGRLEFLNLWYLMIIANDILIIFGSAIKEQIDRKQLAGDQWNICSVFLGTGNLLVWFGVLRYLGFFKTYNVVILTLRNAAPKVARFSLCALLIYAGFTFCGWLVLGPYHIKFRSLASTSECLFALINGDDMFATFSIMPLKSPMLWWYCRFYLYSFISLYIYVVLSLFISIIMDAYETIKLYYKEGFPKSDVQAFMASCTDEASSGVFRSGSFSTSESVRSWFDKLFCRIPLRKPFSGTTGSRFM